MKIAYCIPSIESSGGMERILSLKANYMAEQFGYEVFIIITEKEKQLPFFSYSSKLNIINLGINYDELWSMPLLSRFYNYSLKQKEYKIKLTKCLNGIKPDITISLLRREINFISSLKDGSLKIGEFHFNKDNYRDYRKSIPNERLRKFISHIGMLQLIHKLKRMDMFVVLSPEDQNKWTELKKICVIPNPLPFYPKEKASLVNKKAIAVGRNTYQKGFDLLIEAWKIVNEKHPEWRLSIYGCNRDLTLQRKIESLNLQSVCTLHEPVKNIEEKYLENSIYILSSRYEGFPMVLIESMACGVPSVSFACPCGPKDIIADEEDGLLAKKNDVTDLAEKIIVLIENEDKRQELGTRARENVTRFQLDRIMEQWRSLFLSILETKNNYSLLFIYLFTTYVHDLV